MPVRTALAALLLAAAALAQPPIPRIVPDPADSKPVSAPPPPRELRLDRAGNSLPAGAIARLGVPPPLSGFTQSVAWTADGRQIVAVDWTGITLLDAATGRWVETQTLSNAGYNLSTPLPQNGRLLYRQAHGAGALYDTASAAHVLTFRLPASFEDPGRRTLSVCVSADHRFLAGVSALATGPGVGWRYDVARGRITRLIHDRADLYSLRLAPDGRRAYATGGTQEPELTARDVASGKELWTVPLNGVGTLRAVSADGRWLAVTDGAGLVVFDAADGRAVLSAAVDTDTPRGLWGIDLSPDGRWLALADYHRVTVWDVNTGKVRHRLPHTARLVAFSPDGKSLVSASAWVQRWDVETGKPAYPAAGLDRPIGAVLLKWSGDGKRLLTVWPGDRKGEERDRRPDLLTVWNVAAGETVWWQRSPPAVLTAALDRAGTTVRAATADHRLRVWDLNRPDAAESWPIRESPGGTGRQFHTFLPDGRLAVQSHTVVQVDLDIYGLGDRVVRALPYRGPPGELGAVPYRYGVGTVAVGPIGSRVDLLTGRAAPRLSIPGPIRGVLAGWINAPNPFLVCRVSTQAGPGVHVWEARTGHLIAARSTYVADYAAAALSPDGRFLADGTEAQTYVTDLAAPARTHRLPVQGTSALAFSPDARRLATAHADGTVLIWDLPRPPAAWDPTRTDQLWADLAADARRAWLALWHLLDHPDRAVELLAARLRPAPVSKDTPDLIAKLDNPKYAVREEASRKLAERAEHIEVDLLDAHRRTGSAEQRARLEALLHRLDPAVPPAGETLRGLRAVWLLERIGTAEAKRLLGEVAGGASGSRVTGEAKAALERLGK